MMQLSHAPQIVLEKSHVQNQAYNRYNYLQTFSLNGVGLLLKYYQSIENNHENNLPSYYFQIIEVGLLLTYYQNIQ